MPGDYYFPLFVPTPSADNAPARHPDDRTNWVSITIRYLELVLLAPAAKARMVPT